MIISLTGVSQIPLKFSINNSLRVSKLTIWSSYPARLGQCRNGREELPKSEVRGGGQEELPHAPKPEARGGDRKSYSTPEARGSGWEDQPHVQGAVGARVQEGLEELSHVEGQEGRRWGGTPRPR